jgi:hypothetical protein
VIKRTLVALLAFLLSSAAMAQQQDVARVSAFSSGKLLLNGKSTDLQSLDAELKRLKAIGGSVWYYRENPQSEPPSQAMEAIKLVVHHQLPISMSSKPDFSDYIDENGRSVPRKP